MKTLNRKKNMYDTQLDYIKTLIEMEKYSDAIDKLNYIKNKLERKNENKK